MPDLHAVSREHFAGKYWKPKTDYRFAAKDAYCPLVVHEMPKAMMYFPIAFIKQEEHFIPVALQGLKSGSNLYVAPNGLWLSRYVPFKYQTYPFQFAHNQNGENILCFDKASDLLNEEGQGFPFFQDNHEPHQRITQIVSSLDKAHESWQLTQQICDLLQELELIQNWPLQITSPEEGEVIITDLYRIDELALKELNGEILYRLNSLAGLTLAYSQLFSTENTNILLRLLELHASQTGGKFGLEQLGEPLFTDNDSLNFDNF